MINHTHLLMFVKYRDTSEQRKAFHFFLPISYSNSVHAEPVEAWTEYSRKTGPFTLRPRSGRTDSLMLVYLSLYYAILDSTQPDLLILCENVCNGFLYFFGADPLGCKPRPTDIRPWLCGAALRSSPEHSFSHSRAGRSVVRGKRCVRFLPRGKWVLGKMEQGCEELFAIEPIFIFLDRLQMHEVFFGRDLPEGS